MLKTLSLPDLLRSLFALVSICSGGDRCLSNHLIEAPTAGWTVAQIFEHTMETIFQIFREKGIRGVNKGVNAVALRQVTSWLLRIGISRFVEETIRSMSGKSKDESTILARKYKRPRLVVHLVAGTRHLR